ncbi:MAG: hypothetical protein MJ211_03895 [Bacteroidales bacterium]|nr:hypothetical protein [Bacteroidales bacterium]
MNQNFLSLNANILSKLEIFILYNISILPNNWYSIKYFFNFLDLKSDSNQAVDIFNSIHELSKKGWLFFNKDCFLMNDFCKQTLFNFSKPNFKYIKNIVNKLSVYFADFKFNNRNFEYEDIAINIFEYIKKPTKQIAILAHNFSQYFNKFKQKSLALKYSDLAVKIQTEIDDNDDDLCTFYAEKANILNSNGKYSEAIDTGIKCLDFCVINNNVNKTKTYALALCYSVLSSAWNCLKDYNKSLIYSLLAIKFGEDNNVKNFSQSSIFNNLAISYFKINDFINAKDFIIKAFLEFCYENGHKPNLFSKLYLRKFYYQFRFRLYTFLKK